MQTIPLWPVTIYDFQWADHNQYQKRLREICYELEQQKNVSNVAPNAKHGLYESGFDFITFDDPAVLALSHYLKDCFFKAASNANKGLWPAGLNLGVELHESWCHITRNGGYHDMHVHPMSSWSAIYYLDTAEMDGATKNGLNRFFRPYANMYTDAGTAFTAANTSIDINADSGMVIVFPSWVPHSALPYYGKKDRLVIAVNCRINKMTNVTINV